MISCDAIKRGDSGPFQVGSNVIVLFALSVASSALSGHFRLLTRRKLVPEQRLRLLPHPFGSRASLRGRDGVPEALRSLSGRLREREEGRKEVGREGFGRLAREECRQVVD